MKNYKRQSYGHAHIPSRSPTPSDPPKTMPKADKSASLLTTLLAALGLGQTALAANPGLQLARTEESSAWSIIYNGTPLLVYAFDPQKYKPYVKELRTIRGDNVLRDAPFDHLHHHALMYGIRVNGINFWEETAGNGVEKVVETTEPPGVCRFRNKQVSTGDNLAGASLGCCGGCLFAQ